MNDEIQIHEDEVMRLEVNGDMVTLEWSFQGDRTALYGSGWCAVVTGLDDKFWFKRDFFKNGFPRKLSLPFLCEYRKLYGGGSAYAYRKNGGYCGFTYYELIDGKIVATEMERAEAMRIASKMDRTQQIESK